MLWINNQKLVCFIAFIALIMAQDLAAQQRVVYVMFNEPIPHTITYANNILDDVDCNEPSVSNSGVNQTSQLAILNGLTSVFNQAGVNNIVFTAQPVASPDVTVFVDNDRTNGPDGALLDECTGLEIDQFNRNKGEEVLVNLSVLSNGLTDVDGAVQVIAHETGHAFGLRHAIWKPDNGNNPRAIMRPGGLEGDYQICSQNCEFLNRQATITEAGTYFQNLLGLDRKPNPTSDTINTVYHLARYVGQQTPEQLESSLICPGSWDTSAWEKLRVALRFRIFGFSSFQTQAESALVAPITLYDVDIHEWYGNDVPRRLAAYDEITLEELIAERWNLAQDSRFELAAASTPGGPKDITLAQVEPENELNLNFNPLTDSTAFSLVQITEPAVFSELVALESDVQTERVFDNGFETNPEQASGLETPTAANPEGPCFPKLTVIKTGDGFAGGRVDSEPLGMDWCVDCQTTMARFDVFSKVILTASAEAGFKFEKWDLDSEVCAGSTDTTCEVTMDSDKVAKAVFEEIPNYTVFIEKASINTGLSPQGGLVTSSPAGIQCGEQCESTFASGETLELSALNVEGWNFRYWSAPAECATTEVRESPTCVFNLTSSTTARAEFEPEPVVITDWVAGAYYDIGLVCPGKNQSSASDITVYFDGTMEPGGRVITWSYWDNQGDGIFEGSLLSDYLPNSIEYRNSWIGSTGNCWGFATTVLKRGYKYVSPVGIESNEVIKLVPRP